MSNWKHCEDQHKVIISYLFLFAIALETIPTNCYKSVTLCCLAWCQTDEIIDVVSFQFPGFLFCLFQSTVALVFSTSLCMQWCVAVPHGVSQSFFRDSECINAVTSSCIFLTMRLILDFYQQLNRSVIFSPVHFDVKEWKLSKLF